MSTVSSNSLIEEAAEYLLRMSSKSTRMCLTVSGHWLTNRTLMLVCAW